MKNCILTDTANQRTFVLNYLNEHGSGTTFDFRNLGIMAPAPRIKELKEKGYLIETILEDVLDHIGVSHRKVARYFLRGIKS